MFERGLAEVVDEHDVALGYMVLCVDDVASIRRDRNAKIDYLALENRMDLPGGEVEIAQSGEIVGGIEVDAIAGQGPVGGERERGNTFDARFGADRIQRSH